MPNNSRASILTKFVTATYFLSGLGVTIFALPNSPAVAATPVDNAGNCSAAKDIGSLTNLVSFKDFVGSFDSEDCYKFTMSVSTPASVFLNGLSAGTQMQLLDSNKTVLKTSTNQGTTWSSSTQTGTTGGSITRMLDDRGTYYVRVSSTAITGNPLYKRQDDSYSLNLIPHNAPNTVIVAASNTATGGLIKAHYTATGTKDQDVINQAIKVVGESGGGTILLLEGTYNISDNIYVTQNNVTLSGVGWVTKLRRTNNTVLEDAGMLRSAFHSSTENKRVPDFSNQRFMHMDLDGNKANQTSTKDAYSNYGTYKDSSFEDLRVHDFGAYGMDPHENVDAGVPTVRLTIKDSLVDHNGKDGITIDNCVDSRIIDNVSDSNGRHGINIVTASKNSTYMNNVVTNNASNGITVQPGAVDLTRIPISNRLTGNIVKFNQGDGIYIYRAESTEVTGNTVASNGNYGIRNRASTLSYIANNTVDDNGQSALNTYPAIYLHGDTFVFSTNNRVENNLVRASTPNRYKWGIAEGEARDDFNTVDNNTFQGVNTLLVRLKGLNSKATNNRIIP